MDDDSASEASDPDEIIELTLPLDSRHGSTVRSVAASLAADAGWSVDDIDDLRLGINEAVAVLADVDAVADARLELRFRLSGTEITTHARRTGVAAPITVDDIDVLAGRILRAVVDQFEVDGTGAFVIVKRATSHGDH